MWASKWDDLGLEHLRLGMHEDGIIADGMVIGVAEGRPFRVTYEVRCDLGWRVRAVRVGVPAPEPPRVDLLSDGEGNWTTPDGRAVLDLDGCLDVDISVTPFTNTLPSRRLGLVPTESAEISVAYIQGIRLQAWPEPQRYTCLEKDNQGGLYGFLSLDGGFTAELLVEDGTLLRTLEGHRHHVLGLAFSVHGDLLASSSKDKTVRVWGVEDGTLLHILKGHTKWVRSVAFSPDRRLLASSSKETTVRLCGIPRAWSKA